MAGIALSQIAASWIWVRLSGERRSMTQVEKPIARPASWSSSVKNTA